MESMNVIRSIFHTLNKKGEEEDNHINTVYYKGEWFWIAREVGLALGYSSDGIRFIRSIKTEWKADVREGEHYIMLGGEELHDFTKLYEKTADSASKQFRKEIMLLTEFGIYKVLFATKKKAGVAFRDHVARVIMPQITRGMIIPKPKEELDIVLEKEREARLLLAEKANYLSAQNEEKRLKSTSILTLTSHLEKSGGLTSDMKTLLLVKVTEITTGENFSSFRPNISGFNKSTTADICKIVQNETKVMLTPQQLGKFITQYSSIKEDRRFAVCKQQLITLPNGEQKVKDEWNYSPEGIAAIKEILYNSAYFRAELDKLSQTNLHSMLPKES